METRQRGTVKKPEDKLEHLAPKKNHSQYQLMLYLVILFYVILKALTQFY